MASIRLDPKKVWEVNYPKQLRKVLKILEEIQKVFNSSQIFFQILAFIGAVV